MTGKKTRASGSIVQLENGKTNARFHKQQASIPVGKNLRTGMHVAKINTENGTFYEAKAAIREFIDEFEGSRVQSKASYTFQEYCERYLKECKAAKSALRQRKRQLKAACEYIGTVKIDEITPSMLNQMYADVMQGEALSGCMSSDSSVNQIRDSITLVLQHATKKGLLLDNPCDSSEPPKMRTKAKKTISLDNIHTLIGQLDPTDPHECTYLLAITLGLHYSEICGLSWCDIDFERNIVNAGHSHDNPCNLKSTKAKSGMRLLPLSPTARDALLKMKEARTTHFAKTNNSKPKKDHLEQAKDAPVIVGHYGERVSPLSMSHWWTIDRNRFDLDGFGLHELRRTYLAMLAMGSGHRNPQITTSPYMRNDTNAKRETIEAIPKPS